MGSTSTNSIGKVTSAAVEQYRFVAISSDTIAHTGAATAKPFGVTQDSQAIGKRVNNAVSGRTKLTVNGSGTAIVAGDTISPGANGIGVKHAGTEGHYHAARALEAASGATQIIWVELFANPEPEPAPAA